MGVGSSARCGRGRLAHLGGLVAGQAQQLEQLLGRQAVRVVGQSLTSRACITPNTAPATAASVVGSLAATKRPLWMPRSRSRARRWPRIDSNSGTVDADVDDEGAPDPVVLHHSHGEADAGRTRLGDVGDLRGQRISLRPCASSVSLTTASNSASWDAKWL